MSLIYTVVFEKEADGGYHVYCPALPGCHSQGDTRQEALGNIREAIQCYIESLRKDGQKVPEDTASLIEVAA
ncbi:MAG: type II toxin-antitoxin system HicB family antitoxin [Candidatus Schekmanbacteria bacterium]|nr:type II toxin-antitoxin system HicB family antitoxin [Candidatus Schekmanbacteria bacterium]